MLAIGVTIDSQVYECEYGFLRREECEWKTYQPQIYLWDTNPRTRQWQLVEWTCELSLIHI